jgi:endonuclease III
MDRDTEKLLRNLRADLKTEEDALAFSEDNVMRLISKVASTRAKIRKIEWHEDLRQLEAEEEQ